MVLMPTSACRVWVSRSGSSCRLCRTRAQSSRCKHLLPSSLCVANIEVRSGNQCVTQNTGSCGTHQDPTAAVAIGQLFTTVHAHSQQQHGVARHNAQPREKIHSSAHTQCTGADRKPKCALAARRVHSAP